MRVALLSILDHAGEAEDGHRAFLTFAGKSLVSRQLELALDLGCERIVCISDNLARPLIALQHRVEAAGARFHVISTPRALGGLVHAADELVVIAEGVLPLAQQARHLLAKGNAVLVLPVEEGLASGFERVDINYAWAGALAMPGRLVERLNQLPPDCDAVSALLRIALQGGSQERELSANLLAEGSWMRLSSQAEADALEPLWLRRLLPTPDPFAPGAALANWLARRFGMSLIDRGGGARLLSISAWLMGFAAIALGWYLSVIAGLCLALHASLLASASVVLGLLENAGATETTRASRLRSALGWFLDLALAILVTLGMGEWGQGWPDHLFNALFLFAALRILAGLGKPRISALAADRLIPGLAFIAAGLGDLLLQSVQMLTLLALIASVAHLRLSAKLTQA